MSSIWIEGLEGRRLLSVNVGAPTTVPPDLIMRVDPVVLGGDAGGDASGTSGSTVTSDGSDGGTSGDGGDGSTGSGSSNLDNIDAGTGDGSPVIDATGDPSGLSADGVERIMTLGASPLAGTLSASNVTRHHSHHTHQAHRVTKHASAVFSVGRKIGAFTRSAYLQLQH